MSSSFIQHFNIEAKYNNGIRSMSLLNEEHGYVPNLDAYINDLVTAVKDELDRQMEERRNSGYKGTGFNFCFDESIFTSVKPFFDVAAINMNLGIIDDDDKPGYIGQYKSDKSGKTDRGYKVAITLDISGKYEDVFRLIRSTFAHELTHAYDDYNRAINHKRSVEMTGFLDGSQKASDIYGWHMSEDTITKMVSGILYRTDEVESNANIGMIKGELNYSTLKQCRDAKDVQEAIRKTDGYRTYEDIIKDMSRLENETDPERQKEILNAFNSTRKHNVGFLKDTPVKTFKKAIRIMRKKVDDFQRRFITQVSKMAFDVFSQVNNNTGENGNPDRIRDLMNKINS